MIVPLHVHSYYSLLEGVISPEDIIDKAISYNLDAIALTDTNAMHGLIPFYKKANEKRIKPLLGTYIDEPGQKKIYALFLAKNFNGYSDICRIITSRKLKNDFSLFRLLREYFPNLFIISASAELLRSIPTYDNIFVELILTEAHRKNSLLLFELAQNRRFKYIISNPVYFSNPEDFLLHKVVTAVKYRDTFENIRREYLIDKEFYFKTPDSFLKYYKKIPQAFHNVEYIVDNCNVDLKLGKWNFPIYPDLPAGQAGLKGEDSFPFLWRVAYAGLEMRYDKITTVIRNRFEEELSVIKDLGLAGYFLVVWDIHREAQRRGMVTIGRGSAANSIISYCLGFTQVDPIKHNFYFERFLNKSRSSPPDIDIDFSWRERDEIIRYVFEKYGYDKVAMISTHVTIRARSAFREVAKAFGISEEEASKISKRIPWSNARNLPNVSRLYPEARSLMLDVEPWKTIVSVASRLADFPRHLSIHPGGIVIAPQKITTYTALEFAKNKGLGLIITQPDMHGIEDIGLIKIDLLSQRSLGVLRETIKQIETNNMQPDFFTLKKKDNNIKQCLPNSILEQQVGNIPTGSVHSIQKKNRLHSTG
jgi:DNA polymerase III alpha subunit